MLLTLDDELMKQLEDLRYGNRIPTIFEAIRRITRASLTMHVRLGKTNREGEILLLFGIDCRPWGGGTMRMLIFGALSLFITACVTNPKIESLNPSELEVLSRLQILEGEISEPYDIISKVKGISCHTTADQRRNYSTDDAIEGIKMKAAQLHADAVINIVCERDGATDWMNECWSSMVCVGTAIKYK